VDRCVLPLRHLFSFSEQKTKNHFTRWSPASPAYKEFLHMRDILNSSNGVQARCLLFFLFLLIAAPRTGGAATMEARYPGLATGMLRSAVLAPLDKDTLLAADGLTITRSQLLEGIQDQEPKLRAQLEKNLFFLLEQEAVRRILLIEVKKAGLTVADGNDSQAIQALFEKKTKNLSVSEQEARDFYNTNKEMVGGASFDQAADSIRQYLLQDKIQQAVSDFIARLGDSSHMRVNAEWMEEQSRLALENPVDKARRGSGLTEVLIFTDYFCPPCQAVEPFLEKALADLYRSGVKVTFVDKPIHSNYNALER